MASYVYGNTARKELQTVPAQPTRQKREVSQRVQKNNSKALHISRGYVLFLAAASAVALFACVQYLHLQSEVATRSRNITGMQRELAEAKEDNTARYNAIANSINLEEIRDRAMNDLGMVYVAQDQIITYKNPMSNQVTQYAGIPENGVLASVDVTE